MTFLRCRESDFHIPHADPDVGNFPLANNRSLTLLDWELAVLGPPVYDCARMDHLMSGSFVPQTLGGPHLLTAGRVQKIKRVMIDTVKFAPLPSSGRLTPELVDFIETDFRYAVLVMRQLSGHSKPLPDRPVLEILSSWQRP
ncbi:phosphotransferase [Nocardia sienata]|uniref:phosphotransferase n=1 Tax=Nocardia sienata TaxID=248552 RepID=UPI0007A4A494|nr:phosphotransferase [Nocardia sienata]